MTQFSRSHLVRPFAAFALLTSSLCAQTPAAPSNGIAPSEPQPFRLQLEQSYSPLAAYSPSTVPKPNLDNSPRLNRLVVGGKLQLSLKDAIELALENNLDLAIARYNLPIADTDILRTRGGGSFRGVNTGVVQGTPGGGVGGYGAGAPGAGAGGTSGGAGGAGAGASGLVQSTLGAGTAVSSYDPNISISSGIEDQSSALSNRQIYGVDALRARTGQGSISYSQAFPTGTTFSFSLDNSRQTTNSIYTSLSPMLGSQFRVGFRQQLLAGFGVASNLRFIRIAQNNKKISNIAFREQVAATVTQIENIYWNLVNAYEQARVSEQSLDFARQNLENARKQLQLQAVPALDVLRAEAEVSNRDQDLTVARTNLELQQSLMKNALTRNLDDPALEAMPVIPTDRTILSEVFDAAPLSELLTQAFRNRPELAESEIDLQNRQISRQAARKALLPQLSLVASYGGTGLGGELNPVYSGSNTSDAPTTMGGALANAFNNSYPDYYVGMSLQIPLRNRVAKADQYRSELEYRQAELRSEQLKKQIRIEVRNARYALEQSSARIVAARKARDLAARTFEITQKELELGAGSSFQVLTAQHNLALAELSLVDAVSTCAKARVELTRVTGATLEQNGISIDNAISGTIAESSR